MKVGWERQIGLPAFFVQNPVAVEEDGSQVAQDGADNGVFHPVMIATVFTRCLAALEFDSERNGAMPNSPMRRRSSARPLRSTWKWCAVGGSAARVEAIARAMMATLRAGGKILWCGQRR